MAGLKIAKFMGYIVHIPVQTLLPGDSERFAFCKWLCNIFEENDNHLERR